MKNTMRNIKKLPERPEPHIPEVNPYVLPGPDTPRKHPEIIPEQIPQPSQPAPEVVPPGKKEKQ